MSLDIWLTEKTGAEVFSKNITHNLNRMWKEAGIYDALYNSEGKTATEILPILKRGLEEMAKRPSHFKQYDAANGWGTYNHALPWLAEVIENFEMNHYSVIGISK